MVSLQVFLRASFQKVRELKKLHQQIKSSSPSEIRYTGMKKTAIHKRERRSGGSNTVVRRCNRLHHTSGKDLLKHS